MTRRRLITRHDKSQSYGNPAGNTWTTHPFINNVRKHKHHLLCATIFHHLVTSSWAFSHELLAMQMNINSHTVVLVFYRCIYSPGNTRSGKHHTLTYHRHIKLICEQTHPANADKHQHSLALSIRSNIYYSLSWFASTDTTEKHLAL